MLLQLEGVTAGYNGKVVLNQVNLAVAKGEIVTLLGPNGAGKSTTLKAIFGQVKLDRGSIRLAGSEIAGNKPVQNVQAGIAYVIQGGRVFADLTVEENLYMGGYTIREPDLLHHRLEQVYTFFPELRARKRQRARTMSGGERQMLALGTSLMLQPQLWLLDEPSIGLAPKLVTKTLSKVKEICRALDTTVLLVEQKARQALTVADRVYVMKVGSVVDEGPPEKYATQRALRAVYLPIEREEVGVM